MYFSLEVFTWGLKLSNYNGRPFLNIGSFTLIIIFSSFSLTQLTALGSTALTWG